MVKLSFRPFSVDLNTSSEKWIFYGLVAGEVLLLESSEEIREERSDMISEINIWENEDEIQFQLQSEQS